MKFHKGYEFDIVVIRYSLHWTERVANTIIHSSVIQEFTLPLCDEYQGVGVGFCVHDI